METTIIHILLADDDEGDRLLFKEAFSEIKIKTSVNTVNNGIQLMERLNNTDVPLPDIIFLDLNMPGKNGFECLKEIRGNAKLKDIAIAIFSTSDYEKDVDEAFLNGANIYITKPNDYDSLKQILQKAVSTSSIYQGGTLNREHFLFKI